MEIDTKVEKKDENKEKQQESLESNENRNNQQKTVGHGEYVPFFERIEVQLKFEFFYLIIVLIIAIISLFFIRQDIFLKFSQESKWYLYAGLGGLLGGWAYDVKWFYRVTGRGKDNQYPWKYEQNKFYWRFFVPFLSAVTGFSFFTLIISGMFPLITIKKISGATAYSFSFVTGYFSDIVYSKLANWFENTLGPKNIGVNVKK